MGPLTQMTHVLKTWPRPFVAAWFGKKKHEIRKNDRDFKVGDTLILREWDPDSRMYSGRQIRCLVSYLSTGGSWGLPDDLCVMSIDLVARWRENSPSDRSDFVHEHSDVLEGTEGKATP